MLVEEIGKSRDDARQEGFGEQRKTALFRGNFYIRAEDTFYCIPPKPHLLE
ncbi:MAG: hypothetical protein LBJ59_06980 [Zoogloeaceae bacterium]|jgi:hypothetical protein|nr:hypothetical protein [Zoogloeaceae bacterium]